MRLNEHPAFASHKHTCSFCTRKADASWTGDVQVYICRQCAVSVLPKLMADAVFNSHAEAGHFQRAWDLAQKDFWYAVAAGFQLSLNRSTQRGK